MRLLLRCDGGPATGVGHVVRSLAIAEEAVARGHEVTLSGRLEGDLLTALVDGAGSGLVVVPAVDGGPLAELALAHDVVHVDHYGLAPTLLATVEALTGARAEARGEGPGAPGPVVSVVADGPFGAQPADVLIDPTVGAELVAPAAPARWHLRGGRFAALRRAVTQAAHDGPGPDGPVRVLVVMGGTDPLGCAPHVVRALDRCEVPVDATVVSAPGTADALAEAAAQWRHGVLRVTRPLADLPAAMAAADVVVTAAGTSMWELGAMGRAMAVVAVVDNQRIGYDQVVGAGAGVGLGGAADLEDAERVAALLVPLLVDPGARARSARSAHRLVDGRGAWRIVRMLETAVAAGPRRPPEPPGPAVGVRPATADDADLLLAWRNDPTTRAVSRQQDAVDRPAHVAWLEASLRRPDRHLLVGRTDGRPVGTVRWDDRGDGEWEVSITVAPEARGRRVAPSLLAAAELWLASRYGSALRGYLAVLHEGNTASRRLFVGAGYAPDLPPDDAGFERWVRSVRSGPR